MHVDTNAVSHVLHVLGVLHQCESSAAVLGAEYGWWRQVLHAGLPEGGAVQPAGNQAS